MCTAVLQRDTDVGRESRQIALAERVNSGLKTAKLQKARSIVELRWGITMGMTLMQMAAQGHGINQLKLHPYYVNKQDARLDCRVCGARTSFHCMGCVRYPVHSHSDFYPVCFDPANSTSSNCFSSPKHIKHAQELIT